jgi:predicted metalloprotease with PDZ domain
MAAAMDDRIQAGSRGAKSLRDAFRFLVAQSARERRPLGDGELPALIREATGIDTQDIYAQWMRPLEP